MIASSKSLLVDNAKLVGEFLRANLSEAPLRAGYILILILFGGFGSWAVFAPIESSAIASGTVQVEGNVKPVEHLEGGMVAEIFVSNGDEVELGQPLLQLDRTVIQAELEIIKGKIWTQQARADRLTSERDDLEQVAFSAGLASAVDQRAIAARNSELAIFTARRASRLGEVEVGTQRIRGLQEQIDGTTEVLAAKNTVVTSIKNEIGELNKLLADGFVDKQRVRELNRVLATSLGELADIEAKKSSQLIAQKEAELALLQIDKRFKMQVVDDLRASEEALFDSIQKKLAYENRNERTLIIAPNPGIILGLNVNTLGAVIAPGEAVLSIVPNLGDLVVRAKFSPMDIDRIEIGQEAEIRFSVFKDSYSISGLLTQVSADALLDDASGMPYFDAIVELSVEDIPLLGDNRLSPGMPAQVLVKTGTRSFIGYLTSSLKNIFASSLTED